MKYALIVLLAFISFLSVAMFLTEKKGLEKFNYQLSDGEALQIDTIINPEWIEELINTTLNYPNLNSAVIRSFETDSNNVLDLITWTNHIALKRNMGYWSLTPNAYYGSQYSQTRVSYPTYAFPTPKAINGDHFNWKKIDSINNYYRKLFKSKTARTILFEQALEIVSGLCSRYPSDYKQSVIKELNQLLVFTNSLPNLGKVDTDNLNDYWEGFIYRRYKVDNVPIDEIKSAIIKAQTKIKSLDVSQQPDAMYEITINNQVSFFYRIENFVLHSKVNNKDIPFDYETSVQTIKYFKDVSGEYYQLIGMKNSVPFTYLYDKNLLKIE